MKRRILWIGLAAVLVFALFGVLWFAFRDSVDLIAVPVIEQDYILTRDVDTSGYSVSSGSSYGSFWGDASGDSSGETEEEEGSSDGVPSAPVIHYVSPEVDGVLDPDAVFVEDPVSMPSRAPVVVIDSVGLFEDLPEDVPLYVEVDEVVEVLEQEVVGEVFHTYRQEIDRYLEGLLRSRLMDFRLGYGITEGLPEVTLQAILDSSAGGFGPGEVADGAMVLIPFVLDSVGSLDAWVPLYTQFSDDVLFVFLNYSFEGSDDYMLLKSKFSELGFDFKKCLWYDHYSAVYSAMTEVGFDSYAFVGNTGLLVSGGSGVPSDEEFQSGIEKVRSFESDYAEQVATVTTAFYAASEYLYYQRLLYCLARDEVEYSLEVFSTEVQSMVQAIQAGLSYADYLAQKEQSEVLD